MKEFREYELLNILNKQYSGMNFKEPKKVELNSVVLLRNIANESKREPMKLARVLQINESKDNAQRILTLEYNNIKKNKEGNWIGTPKIVERSINDVILIDKAINESLLNSGSSETEVKVTGGTREDDENIIHEENVNGETEELIESENLNQNDNSKIKEDNESVDKNDNHEAGNQIQVRKSGRIRKRIVDLNPEDIGDNDNANDEDYKS